MTPPATGPGGEAAHRAPTWSAAVPAPTRAFPGRPAGLILAAGAGTRFGGPKALGELDGEALLDRAVRLALTAGLSEVLVVLGAGADQVRARGLPDGARAVVHEGWAAGLGSSLRAGLAAASAAALPAVVVTLVDQPWLGPASVRRLVRAWSSGARAAVATYGGRPGHPVLLDASVFAEVAASCHGEVGARGYLRAHPDLVMAVDCSATGSDADMDTPGAAPPELCLPNVPIPRS